MNDDPAELGKPWRPASAHTCRINAAAGAALDFSDDSCFDEAQRGFVGSIPDARIEGRNGQPVWDLSFYRFLEESLPPDTVNPSLWRQARLNRLHGLFEVVPGVYQVRGLDLANMTIIEGERGIVIIDVLTNVEAATAAVALYRAHRGERPVSAVIYSHSHMDHFGGAEGVVSAAQAASGEVHVIAPDGFMHEAISEAILAGVPMRRRSLFQFGPTLPPGPRGHVDSGLGKVTGRGTSSLVEPNWLITEAFETHVIDGVEIVFQLTPETEAPAEMNFFLPRHKVLNLAENGCHTMHNLCPIRGAKTRDALAWSKYLGQALERFVEDTEVVIAQHHWPTWGRERVRRFVSEQRDLYRYLHDQTLRWMSHGLTPDEVGEKVDMPPGLENAWHARPYYGALVHNVRAIYCHYLGPYDGRPSSLHPYAPEPAARRYLRYMGGAEAVLLHAREDFEAGDYRWVVQVLQHVVFAEPANMEARELCAAAMEQLAYQAESSTWRNAYLLGAQELRDGPPKPRGQIGIIAPRIVAMMPMDMFFDYLAVRIDGPRAGNRLLRLDWRLTDEASQHKLTLSHGALNHAPGSHGAEAQVTLSCTRQTLSAIVIGGTTLAQALAEGQIAHEGDVSAARELFELLEVFQPMFAILTP
ncbi:MAG: alkyl sulfatase dimerization domain-containing protein [Burkholderiaceae bacterium]